METIIETAKFIGLAILAYFSLSVILAFLWGVFQKIFHQENFREQFLGAFLTIKLVLVSFKVAFSGLGHN
ncbi:hypothetical protein JI641_03755 [Listeria ivanovii subsp. londoniensis]|uniref:hypothetical protein n=1 Tax=Listeria ivanovii TaxID=1638 RepID=UPI0019081006|nr:hypothetical protein [Listeria ivanovii]MBK2002128.1 hypothetical protein [Listeria ivanovii subsp. londoniensis]